MTGLLSQSPQTEVFAVFAGAIDQMGVQRLFQGVTGAMANRIQHIHLLFQSTGGFVGDGICLYNFFRTLPAELTLYNAGSISSISVIAYLGAKKRKVSAHATFMVHRTHASPQAATADRLQSLAQSLSMDDQRTEAILRQHLTLTEEKWRIHSGSDLWLTAQDAVDCGLADEIAEFSPPVGSQVFNV